MQLRLAQSHKSYKELIHSLSSRFTHIADKDNPEKVLTALRSKLIIFQSPTTSQDLTEIIVSAFKIPIEDHRIPFTSEAQFYHLGDDWAYIHIPPFADNQTPFPFYNTSTQLKEVPFFS